MQNANFMAPHAGRPGAKPQHQTPRSSVSLNLVKLAKAVNHDILASALGVSSSTLKALLDGRDSTQLAEQQAHIAHRLEDAGFARNWLNTPNAFLHPAQANALRKLASQSSDKGPIRRSNLKKILAAFSGRNNVLADALEVNESSLYAVADGLLEFDEQRVNHFNPRLIQAGFEGDWLDQPDSGLTNELVQALEALATDTYERSFEAVDESPPAATSVVSTILTQNLAQTKDAQHDTPPVPQVTIPAAAPAQKPAANPLNNISPNQENAMSTATAKTTMKLSRLVKGAGRPLIKTALAAPIVAKAAEKGKVTEQAVAPKGKAATKAVKEKGTSLNPKSQTPRRSLGVDRNDGLTVEQSLARIQALDKLLEGSRRGAKSTLWNDLLGSSLPQAGNIRSGKGFLRDELADRITESMGLPKGWLDNPVFPPPTMAAWVTDETVPLPGKKQPSAPAANQGYVSVGKPFMRPGRKPEPSVTMAPGADKNASGTPAAALQATAPTAPAPQAAPAPAAAPVTLKVEHSAPYTPDGRTFYWKGAVNPQAIAAPGPLTQAAISVLKVQAEAGKFTEEDAMRLLQYLSTQG